MHSAHDIFDSAIRQALRKYYGHRDYEDMYQECYMKILSVLEKHTYDPVYNLYGYAYSISRNAINMYLYHSDKLTTLREGDLVDIVPLNVSGECVTYEVELLLMAEFILDKYKGVLPEGFNIDDMMSLIYGEEPSCIVLSAVKGDFIWHLLSDNIKH